MSSLSSDVMDHVVGVQGVVGGRGHHCCIEGRRHPCKGRREQLIKVHLSGHTTATISPKAKGAKPRSPFWFSTKIHSSGCQPSNPRNKPANTQNQENKTFYFNSTLLWPWHWAIVIKSGIQRWCHHLQRLKAVIQTVVPWPASPPIPDHQALTLHNMTQRTW